MPEKKLDEGDIKERIVQAFDIARAEGMLHSEDGKHSQSSVYDAEDVIELVSEFYRQEVVDFIRSDIFPLLSPASFPVRFKDKWNSKLKGWFPGKKEE